MKNVLLTIEYDGTNFSGWQRQPGKRTVQGELERVLSELCHAEIRLNGTSRTDAGVHALGQRASFAADFGIPIQNIPRAANNLLAGGMNRYKTGDIRIREAAEASLDFHARFDARGKTYIYKINAGGEPDMFRRNYSYYLKDMPNVALMREAARHMVGSHDFKSFEASGGNPRETTIRTIYELDIRADGAAGGYQAGSEADDAHRDIEIRVTGDGFLYNMVRIITGTLVDVGLGRISPAALPDILAARDRQAAGHTAPPHGLYLAKVYFREDDMF